MEPSDRRCEDCHVKDGSVKLHQNDFALCWSCHPRAVLMENKDSIEEDTNDFDDAMTAMMVGQEAELEILEELDQLPIDSNTSLVIKNNPADENCVKCNKKLCSGLRCTNREKAWHWRCAGMTEDTVKALVITENVWKCQLCRNADSSCPVCRVKESEIRNLKKSITELEVTLNI